MKQYLITSADGIDAMELREVDTPKPKPDEILVKMRANSLNYRDLIITMGGYTLSDTCPVVPLSDGAGDVVEVGSDVTDFSVGDKVVGNFIRDWTKGVLHPSEAHSALGGGIDGTLAEYVTFKQKAAVHIPDHLNYEEAATLPCAALTAWHALQKGNLKAGDKVLLLGTGGVSMFGLQFAKAQGAHVIITSSSDEKLEKAKALGADEGINYNTHPEWSEKVMELTDGQGVDNVLEIGGETTMLHSFSSTRVGGTISLIGLVSGADLPMNLVPALRLQTIQGIYVGSTEMFKEMNKAISQHKIKPIIDRSFAFDEAKAAYHHLQSANHIGKVVITHDA